MSAATSKEVSLLEMLQAGVHFGHKTSKRHPKMEPFLFGARNGISVINLESTKAQLAKVLPILEEMVAQGKTVVFVGTKRQAKVVVKATAESIHMPYLNDRWIGGLLTNYASVGRLMRKLTQLKDERDQGIWKERYTKKEALVLEREVERLEALVGGIESMTKLPDALFVIDCNRDRTAIQEANTMHIPVFAMVDSNVNPSLIQYPIPANDDGTKSIIYILELVAEAVKAGTKRIVIPEPVVVKPVAGAPKPVVTPVVAPAPVTAVA